MRFPSRFKSLCAIAALSFTVSGCLVGNSGGGNSDPGTPPGTAEVLAKYNLKDGKLLFPRMERTRYACGADNEVLTIVDTTFEDSGHFELSGDSLSLLGLVHPHEFNSGARVQLLQVYKRKGSGTGIEGQWTFSRWSFRVLAGELTAEEREGYDIMSTEEYFNNGFINYFLVIGNGEITRYTDIERAELFRGIWNGRFENEPLEVDSARYSVSVKVVDKYTVELKGAVTSESIRIVYTDEGSRTYSSNFPAHAVHHYDSTPKSCPNDFEPAWYRLFLDANSKP